MRNYGLVRAAKVLEDYGWRVLQLRAADASVTGDQETGLGQADEASGSKNPRQTTLLTKVSKK